MRLFVAINLPDDIRQGILRAAEPVRRLRLPVKWVEASGIHLTLKFLGEVTEARLGELAAGLERAAGGARAFTLPIGGFGAFPAPTRARVVWVGCEAAPALELLQHGIEKEYAALGFPIEGRPFRPHLTLGRAKGDARGGVRGLAEPLARLVYEGEAVVRSVELMQSQLAPAGARYTARHSVALAEAP